MWDRWRSMLVLFGLTGLAIGGDGRRLRNYCYLPKYDYKVFPNRRSRLDTIVSAKFIEDGVAAARLNPSGPKNWQVRQFQFAPTAGMLVDHCAVSQIAVTLVEDGSWSVNFLAEQNPQLAPTQLQPALVRFRRNQFHLELRAVGLAQEVALPDQPVLGKPAAVVYRIPPFWIEQGQREFKQFDGQSPDLQRMFQQIDRVELDLSYE